METLDVSAHISPNLKTWRHTGSCLRHYSNQCSCRWSSIHFNGLITEKGHCSRTSSMWNINTHSHSIRSRDTESVC